jgi:hypothetical protein
MGKTSNLAGLLAGRFGWDNFRDAAWVVWRDVPGVGDVTFKTLMYAVFLVMLAACAVAAAAKDRRNDRTFLIAVTAPWVVFFAFGTQVHERYLLFAAGVASVLAACGVGWVLLGLFLTAVTFAMTIDVMLIAGRRGDFGNGVYPAFGEDLYQFVSGTHPDIGWAVTLVALIFLYKAIVPGRGKLVARDV